ncbi:hypothetical protein SDC9_119271 [bioreactor metagenome]|uniref:Uncharacterized protein n=1 Tax=bioreactor metagenome TaxID=1076179 RepID=A0A645C4J3_9ZZZZ
MDGDGPGESQGNLLISAYDFFFHHIGFGMSGVADVFPDHG